VLGIAIAGMFYRPNSIMDIKPSEFYLWNLRYSIFQWQQFEFPSMGAGWHLLNAIQRFFLFF
jgi:hypothetical protein